MSPTLLFIYSEIQELSKTNDVLLVATERVPGSEKNYPFENLTVIPYTPNTVARKISWVLEKRDIYLTRKNHDFSKKINALIASFKPDIIHGHFGYESIILLENIKKPPCPIFISFHGFDASEMLKLKCYVKKLNYYIEKLHFTPICVSNFMRQDMENAGINLKSARLLYYGTDLDFFKPGPKLTHTNNFIFLQISSFLEKKGHIYTMLAFKKFLETVPDKTRYKLILAGGGPLFEKVKSESIELDLSKYIEFPGILSHKDTLPFLQNADVFVHHSITSSSGMKEGIPNALMEAMAMELPVISTLHAGIPELVEDGVNGYLVAEKDTDAYAGRMKDILSWKRLPVNRQKVQDLFSRKAHYRNLMNIYQKK